MGGHKKSHWGVRRELTVEWFNQNPSTTKQAIRGIARFHPEFAFPCYQVASRNVTSLERRRTIRLIGRLFRDTGRPENIYYGRGGYKMREDWARHEALLTEFLLGTPGDRWVRLWDVSKDFDADAEIELGQGSELGGLKVYVEIDCGTTPYRKLIAKLKKYGEMLKDKELVVWVTLTQRRLKGFLKRAHHLNGKGMFTVLGWSYWVDTDRNKIPMKWDRPTPGNSGD